MQIIINLDPSDYNDCKIHADLLGYEAIETFNGRVKYAVANGVVLPKDFVVCSCCGSNIDKRL